MSLTPHTRKERSHGGNKMPAHSSENDSLSRTASQYPCEVDSQGLMRTPSSSASGPRTFMQDLSLLFAGVLWTSWGEPGQQAWLSLVKEEIEKELECAQYMMTQDTVTTTTTTSTVYGSVPRMDGSYMVERIVQSESSRQQVVYLASGEGS